MLRKCTKPFHAYIYYSLILFCLTAFFLLVPTVNCQEKIALQASKKTGAVNISQISILFAGDTWFGETNSDTRKLLAEKGYDYPLQGVAPLLANSDLVIANLETPITNLTKSPFETSKIYIHRTDILQAPEIFKKYNLLTFSLANNHTMDYGIDGLKQTLGILSENDLRWFGAGMNEEEATRPFIQEFMIGDKPFRIAVLGTFEYFLSHVRVFNFYATGSKGGIIGLNPRKLAKQIRSIKEEDPETYVIIFPHWGDNYSWKSAEQTRYAHAMIEAGADLIIGHGAHSMQEIEKYAERWIIYSLGNFVFLNKGRYAERNWIPYSFAAKMIITDFQGTLSKQLLLYPIISDNLRTGYRPRPLNSEEFEKFQQLLISKSLLTSNQLDEISSGQDSFGFYLQLPTP